MEYDDGIGCDGKPIKALEGWQTYDQRYQQSIGNATLGVNLRGQTPSPPLAVAEIPEWDTWVYGKQGNKPLTSWVVPEPSADYHPCECLAAA